VFFFSPNSVAPNVRSYELLIKSVWIVCRLNWRRERDVQNNLDQKLFSEKSSLNMLSDNNVAQVKRY
jgi:hypothetical protein